MHAIIYGAGALGCYFGALLQQSGHAVTYIARGAHLKSMQTNGLSVESSAGNFHLESVRATSDIAEVDIGDLIFFAVKNYDVENSIPELAKVVGPDTAVITVQNGVSAQPILAKKFGAHRIFPGAVRLPASIKSPGVVRTPAAVEMDGIVLGPYEGGASTRANTIQEAFEKSGIATQISEDVWRSLWEKFIPLSAFSALTVSARLDIGALRDRQESRAILRSLIDETTAIACASHATVPEDAGQTAFDFLMNVPPNIHASMLDDLIRGKRIELEWLSGEVIKRGRKLGIATPTHELVYAILSPYIDGRPEGSH